MRQVILDFSKFSDRAEVHDFLASELSFPAYYGRNLDALMDVLTDPMELRKVYIFPAGKPFEKGFLKVFREAAEENPALLTEVEQLPGNYSEIKEK